MGALSKSSPCTYTIEHFVSISRYKHYDIAVCLHRDVASYLGILFSVVYTFSVLRNFFYQRRKPIATVIDARKRTTILDIIRFT